MIVKLIIFGLMVGVLFFVGFYSGNFLSEYGVVFYGWVSVLMVVVILGIVFVFNGF